MAITVFNPCMAYNEDRIQGSDEAAGASDHPSPPRRLRWPVQIKRWEDRKMMKTGGRRLLGFRFAAVALVMLAFMGFVLAVHVAALEPTQTSDGTDTAAVANDETQSPGTLDGATNDDTDSGIDDGAVYDVADNNTDGGTDDGAVNDSNETDAGDVDEENGLGRTAITAYTAASFADLGVTPEQIEAVLDQGYGFGEIVIALSIARESGQTLDDVLALAAQGLDWKDIAASLGVTADSFGKYVSAVMAGPAKLGDKPGAQEMRKQYDEAALLDLLETAGIDGDTALKIANGYGFEVREVVIAATAAMLSGDSANFELALQMRVQQKSWQEVFATLGIEPKGAVTKFANAQHLEAKLKVAAKKAADKVKGNQGKPGASSGGGQGSGSQQNGPSSGTKPGGKK